MYVGTFQRMQKNVEMFNVKKGSTPYFRAKITLGFKFKLDDISPICSKKTNRAEVILRHCLLK